METDNRQPVFIKTIARQRYFLDFAIASLMRRKWKNISLTAVYSLVVFLLTSVLFFAGAIRQEAERVLEGAPEMIVQRTLAGRHEMIPIAYSDAIRRIRGIQDVTPRLWGYYYHQASRANFTVMATDAFPLRSDQIIIGEGVHRTWKETRGSRLFFKAVDGTAVDLEILDEFAADTALVSSDLILMTEPTFRRIFGVPEGMATDLAATIRNEREAPTIAEKVTDAFPDTRPVLRDEIQRTYTSLFDWRSGYLIVMLSGTLLAFLIFAWDKATGLSAGERSEIGILKAIGWDTGDVLMLKFWEGLAICLTAFLLGTIAAYIHVFMVDAPLFEHALKGWAVLYPDFRLTPAFDVYQLAVVFGLTVFPYSLITIVPAWRVAITDPDAVMR